MSPRPLRERIVPLPASPEAGVALSRLREAATAQGADDALDPVLEDGATAAFLGGALGDCPYLLDLAVKDVRRLAAILNEAPEERLARAVESMGMQAYASRAAMMASLRRAKGDMALTVGLADLGRAFDLDAVTGWLTRFADAALRAALRQALNEAREGGRWQGGEGGTSGLMLLAMGKYGAYELNYSSDVDIIALHDPLAAGLAEGVEPSTFWVRIVRLLVTLLQERTADGYVFRVDLRLRPDPGATPVAISAPAALSYYESMGQNWERAALIKARPAAGDLARGQSFLTEISPFIWRKYLDFAAIADIHSIKRQVHAHHGHGAVRVAGHDIKRGRGGIREVELFAQTQQLIAGGRDASLRGRRTLDTLSALLAKGWITEGARNALGAGYVFLRNVEHRLQMVRDEQTHTLPPDAAGLARIGRLMGFSSPAEFEAALLSHLNAIAERYSRLFGDAPTLSTDTGNLVFTGGDDDPGTLQALARLGYREPSGVMATVRAWHFGRYAAMRSTAARERLTEITPALLETFAKVGNPDEGVRAFDALLKALPAGVQLFAILSSNRQLLDLTALILGTAPKLAETFARRPHVVDALLDPAGLALGASRADLAERLQATLGESASWEDALDRVRLFAAEGRFLIAARLLTGTEGGAQAGAGFSDLAEAVVEALFARAEAEFARQHGRIEGGRAAIVAFGRLGSREMTATSDLDLIVVYDHAPDAAASDGARPLAPAQYYARLTQRLVAALSSPTKEGVAYDVDLRLRPSGRKGPLATHVDGFAHYQMHEAWTWEHMALSRARPVAGDAGLCARVEAIVAEIMSRPRETEALKRDIGDMRLKVEGAKGTVDPWSLKNVRGGLTDAEFAAQYAVLAGLERRPGEPTAGTLARALDGGVLPAGCESLAAAARLQGALLQGLRVAGESGFDPRTAPAGLKAFLVKLAAAAGADRRADTDGAADPDGGFEALEARLRAVQEAARRAFDDLMRLEHDPEKWAPLFGEDHAQPNR